MTAKSIIAAILGFACATTFAYRDAAAQLCNGYVACYQNVTNPCPAGSGGVDNCVAITATNVPGGTKNCINGSTPTYYASGTAPSAWTDCVTMPGLTMNCPRYLKTCMMVYFFASKNDCTGTGTVCASNTVSQCTNGTLPMNGNPGSPGPPCLPN